MLKDKKILIIGGAGFIGSHLAESLVSENEVHILDNLLMGFSSNVPENVHFIRDCARNISNYYEKNEFDFIFHFGEFSRVEQSLIEDLNCYQNSICTFPYILDFVKDTDSKLIYSGSSTKFAENATTLSPYTLAKIHNTELLKAHSEWYNLNYAIVYFYNVYGGRERFEGKYSTVIAHFKNLKKSGASTLPVTSPGTQRRNFTHISDVISGIELVAELGFGDGYGIGSDESFSILEVCDLLGCEPQFMAANPANRLSAGLVTEKTKALGWRSNTSLREHLQNFVYKNTNDF